MVEHNLAKVGVAGSSPVSRSVGSINVVACSGDAIGSKGNGAASFHLDAELGG